MAGGKLTPRQKMINLMYLVFIAMLALNMSKEVLSAFGLMNEKFESVNGFAKTYNGTLLADLQKKAGENKENFGAPYAIAKQVQPITENFYSYIESLKKDIETKFEKEDGKLPYEAMDKGDMIDEKWFEGDGYSKKGKEIIATIEKYKSDMIALFGKDVKYQPIIEDIKAKFNLADIKDNEGVKKSYLDYHFKGFPAIASLAKLTSMQNDIRKTEQDIYNALIGNTNSVIASMKNYKAMVIMDKSAFFQGETVTGKVVSGRYDENTVPTAINVAGGSVSMESGQAIFKLSAGNVGEHDIKGQFTFIEDGKEVPIPIEGNYVVVPKPNSATISADKMNVVYRGVPNPISVSFAGISADKVSASAPGMRPAGKPGQYMLSPGSGNSVMVTVTGTLPDGQKVSDRKEFRIKGLPSPTGKVRGEISAKGPKSNLQVVTISAEMEDFDFPVTVNVTEFTIKVPGQPTIKVSGNKMDSRAKAAIDKAGRGDVVVIDNIKATFSGIDQIAKRVSPCTYEVQ